jgi:predicted enzyme related to lactoylglutathione lyase
MSAAGQDRRIDYVEFPAIDITATKQFYGEVFGWRFEDLRPKLYEFSRRAS